VSKQNSEFDIIWRGLATGLGFVWVMGFAIGYQDPITPWVLFVAAVACLWQSRSR
jgi:hypothetical protein